MDEREPDVMASGVSEGGTGRAFVLGDGYRSPDGRAHRDGLLRYATARDEERALSDFRVFLRPEAFRSVLFARVMVRLGDISRVDAGVVEKLSEADLDLLETLYREMNGYGHGR